MVLVRVSSVHTFMKQDTNLRRVIKRFYTPDAFHSSKLPTIHPPRNLYTLFYLTHSSDAKRTFPCHYVTLWGTGEE